MAIVLTLQFEILGFLIALLVTLAYAMLAGRIDLKGLLQRKEGWGQLSPERIQLLVVTFAVCVRYLIAVVHSIGGNIPDITSSWLYLFGASSSIYLARKIWTSRKAVESLGGL